MIIEKVSSIGIVTNNTVNPYITFILNGAHYCRWHQGNRLQCDSLTEHERNIASLFLITRGFNNFAGFIKQLELSKLESFLF